MPSYRMPSGEMDDQRKNVIDGTARAQQWRRARPKTAHDEARSNAPTSIASSLLVPGEADLEPAIADHSLAASVDPSTAQPTNDASSTDGARTSARHENPFLSSEPAPAARQPHPTSVVVARLCAWAKGVSWTPKVRTAGVEAKRRALLQLAAALALVAAALTGAVVWLNVDGRTEPQAQTVPRLPAGSPDAEDARLASLQKSLAATTAHPSHAPLKQQRPAAAKRSQHRPVHRSAPRPARPASPVHPSAAAHPVSTQSAPSSTSSVSSTPSTPVSSSTPSQSVDVPSSSSTGSVVSEPTQPTSSSTTSGGSATSSHSGGQSSKAKAPAGPTGNSALLGPGHCNC